MNTPTFVPTLESIAESARKRAKDCKEKCKKAEEELIKAEKAVKNAQNARYKTYKAKAEERRRQQPASYMSNEEVSALQRKIYENSKSTNYYANRNRKSRKVRKSRKY